MWVEDMPKKSLVILQSADDILDPARRHHQPRAEPRRSSRALHSPTSQLNLIFLWR